mgnify:FL=1
MAIEGFQYEEFSKELSNQAVELIPSDIKDKQRDFIIDIIYKFCTLAGNALNDDPSLNFTAEQAFMIVQFIGEWTFHKSIDILRANLPIQYRESILQKIAFTIFEIAKQSILRGLNQDQIIMLVEAHVKKTFEATIKDFLDRGMLLEDIAENALKQSNIDQMAKQMQEEKYGEVIEDKKLLKLASLAVVLKRLPKNKTDLIVKKFSEADNKILNEYLEMPDLEKTFKQEELMKQLSEIKKMFCKPVKPKPEDVANREFQLLAGIIKNVDKNKFMDAIDKERESVQRFMIDILNDEKPSLPAQISAIISKHMREQFA